MDWYEEAKKIYKIEDEKVERMAKVQVSEGGRIELPKPGESLLVYITRNPVKVEADKLKERGIDVALFARCRKVLVRNGSVEIDTVEYDLPMSKTMVMSCVASLKRAGSDMNLEGKVFLIVARDWKTAPEEYKKDKGVVKTYAMVYKPDLTESVKVGVKAEDIDYEL